MKTDIILDKYQMKAVEAAVNDTGGRITIINGGAGTGKTTIIAEIVKLMSTRQKAVVCAFAGKAAARLREKGIADARTIHSVLGWNGTVFNPPTALAGSTIIIDEASMVPASLLANVIRAKPRKLVLVGDEAQLPPVGSGQPFHDLIKIMPQCVVTLKISHRASSAIYQAAQCVRMGQVPAEAIDSDDDSGEKFRIIHTGKITREAVLELVRKGELVFDGGTDIILIPRNEDESERLAVNQLNDDIHKILEEREAEENDEELAVYDSGRCGKWKPGDRVINSKNFPVLDWWNGSTGTVASINSNNVYIERDTPAADGDDYVTLGREEIKSLSYAYAVTVHKSQGSEYRRVVVICMKRDTYTLLDRSMLYTAITRAKSACLVMGEKAAIAEAVRSSAEKRTNLKWFAEHDADRMKYEDETENDNGEVECIGTDRKMLPQV